MSKNLLSRFNEEKGGPIDVDGKLTHATFEQIVRPGGKIRIVWLKASKEVYQGLRIQADRPNLELLGMGKRSKNLILWSAKKPEDDLIAVYGRIEVNVLFWNAWWHGKDPDNGYSECWMGNSGIQITEEGNSVLLECSDGIGEPDFSDLVVRLVFES